jgi:hypothetical protein
MVRPGASVRLGCRNMTTVTVLACNLLIDIHLQVLFVLLVLSIIVRGNREANVFFPELLELVHLLAKANEGCNGVFVSLLKSFVSVCIMCSECFHYLLVGLRLGS